ncbi:MAG: hypothetical protein WA160_06870 [Pseudobdellovibrio sp.]
MEYILLPGKNPISEDQKFHKIAYDFWYTNWSNFFKKHDPSYILNPDDFFRQDYIGLLAEGEIPLAIHLYSVFDLSIPYQLNQSYLSYNFAPTFFSTILGDGIKRVMTFEAMMVNPDYRKTETGKSIAPMLFAEGIQLIKSIKNIDAMIAPARRDIGVTKLAHSGGAETIVDHDLHGIPVSLIVGKTEKLHLNFLGEFEQYKAIQIFNNQRNLNVILSKESYGNIKKIAS